MDKNKGFDRLDIMKYIIVGFLCIIIAKIIYMTTFKHEHYNELASNKTYKEIPVKAPRGEIKDRYGRTLAANRNSFTVHVSNDGVNKKDEKGKTRANEISLDLIKLLEKNEEEYIDEFPIYVENGKYFYTFDKNIRDYKLDNEVPLELDAKETFYYIVDKAIKENKIDSSVRNLEPAEIQKKLNSVGIYPPILVKNWKFTEQRNKEDWIKSYKIDNVNINAQNAFKEIRKHYEIPSDLSNTDARKIMIVRDALKSQGYSQYKPVTIAKDINEKTISEIEERAIEFPGVSVVIEPVREYPEKNLASHTLGTMGKINEDELAKKQEDGDTRYSKSDIVGKTGIEKYYEEKLKGEDGYKKVEVDSHGRVSKEIEEKKPVSGDNVYLSIDKDLQKVSDDSLERMIKAGRSGGTFTSVFGNYSTAGKTAPYLDSGAIMVMDAKTGDILAMSSYPNYDPNLFATGISSEEYEKLQPKNPNDVLAANPLSNLVTNGAFQPGSTFKMITGMTGLEGGLSPNYAINDPGVIKLGNRPFADYVWHHGRSNHGYTNLYKAIQESCNIYFYTVGTGYNWQEKKSLGIDTGPEKILEYAKLFGLDKNTGLQSEVGESIGKVPNKEDKLKNTENSLRIELDKKMRDAFNDITKAKNPDEYKERIDEIVSWTKENPSREEIMKRLEKLNVKEDKITEITDFAKFNYFNFGNWSDADTFNLAIGQGENAYTPAQIARYIAAIANGGNLVEPSVVDKTISSDFKNVHIDENKVEKIPFKDPDNLKELTQGMKQVASIGGGKSVFANFPIETAVKTGTAEKSGKIPTENEYDYLISHMGSYGVSKDEAVKEADKLLKEANEKDKIEFEKEQKAEKEKEEKESNKLFGKKEEKEDTKTEEFVPDNSEATKARYLRKAIKELNPKLTDEQIDAYKLDYPSFAWSVGFAPANDPEIVVVTVLPKGNSSSLALPPMREVMGQYFGLIDEKKNKQEKANKEAEGVKEQDGSKMNFVSQLKK
ncbi:penicillin-binding transpeptidase domain-containing protein [Paraclostridium ghonii]|uniref:Penicillin-binding protein 2 n=1 Tax=Paraclostridium ghonii TaxID=29358 RepID=A0ABU0N101_9FIRM|nr:penicillin-binding transpeptidase domain-containing protein [Paeniclostridium ghonii]MDQ0556843.1 penicillin-binding protein 2 [Paeniclostridium ghonii]